MLICALDSILYRSESIPEATESDNMFTIKQTTPILPPSGIEPGQRREPNERYVYFLTAFVSLGALLFGFDQGVMSKLDNATVALGSSAN